MPLDLEDKDSYARLSDEPSIKMPDGSLISPREYKRRFDSEWYNADFYQDEQAVISSEEGRKEAIRMKNSLDRDALSVAEKTGSLSTLSDTEEQFMQDASDEWEWNDVYKILGYEAAFTMIMEQTAREIKTGKIDINLSLARFIVKVLNLRRIDKRRKLNE